MPLRSTSGNRPLPCLRIQKKATCGLPAIHKCTPKTGISQSLQEARINQGNISLRFNLLSQAKLNSLMHSYRKLVHLSEKQKKKEEDFLLSEEKEIKKQKDSQIYTNNPHNDDLKRVIISTFSPQWKPSHRYKTTMGYYQNTLILYGGIGCEKDLKWARFDLKENKWLVPDLRIKDNPREFSPVLPIYGHAMVVHKGKAYIYGGVCCESVMNDLTILDLKDMSMTPFSRAPYRRKEHALTILGKYLIVHGGLENGEEPQNQLFYYDIDGNEWHHTSGIVMNLPNLSHHSMVSTSKQRKKTTSIFDYNREKLFIFGGKNKSGVASNKLFKIVLERQGSAAQQVKGAGPSPQGRHSCCLTYLDAGYLAVYGGMSHIQKDSYNQKRGIFNDIFLFHLERSEWSKLQISLEFRYGMAVTTHRNTVYLFGGCNAESYVNGDVVKINFLPENQQEESQNAIKLR